MSTTLFQINFVQKHKCPLRPHLALGMVKEANVAVTTTAQTQSHYQTRECIYNESYLEQIRMFPGWHSFLIDKYAWCGEV